MWTFNEDKIATADGRVVMHSWEHPIMKAKADWVCRNGGDILELGFGMGISASYIQKHDINSHTICENNPEVLQRLHEWAKDKPNVIILEGDWYSNVPRMFKYDGILLDTFDDPHWNNFPEVVPEITNPQCAITWWNTNPYPNSCESKGLTNTEYEVINVVPVKNDYFNHKQYYLPKCIYV